MQLLFILFVFYKLFSMKYMVHGDENVNSLITQYNVYQSTILIKKAELIIKAIKPACRVLMEPISHSCKVEFESTFNYTKNILFDNDHHGDVRLHFQQSFCCALSHYNDCVMKSIERINTYSLDFCDEIDVLSVESILIGLDKQYETQNSSDMIIRCPKIFGHKLNVIIFISIATFIFCLLQHWEWLQCW
ncbi:hypothetical protein HUG17_8032 [Dermatophagoides farinae]|uniref:Uncharacterized protein n=1 Tax=Dermatophagoides farinae TaxID=6954 RepID=A0A9D4NYC7_DERFA|nr:hypothetical protein HUG17_8032 [Dermatophagoides farinae]